MPKKAAVPEHSITFREAFWVWVKVAVYSFGGPAGQIAVMHRLLVEEKRWVSESRFLHALNYCMLLPGPEAQQLATYIGWLLHKTRGGIVAGTLFVLPGFISILALSVLYAGFQDTSFVQALFFGLKPAVTAVVIEAVIRIGRRALKNEVMVSLAVLTFIAIFFFNVPFPLIILSAGVIGYAGGRLWIEKFYVIKGHESRQGDDKSSEADIAIADAAAAAPHTQPSLARSLRVLVICLLLWFVPMFVLAGVFGLTSVYITEGIFFSKTAVVTFGGAYAVLAYIAQQAVDTYGWLKPGEMLDGLGMAETTPGPLIMVVQFVGFMGAYRNPGTLDPVMAGILGSIVTTWVTFVPCFLWIFLGAPYIEYLRGNKSLSTALSAITAAVVGVILNLAVWFSLHVVFREVNEIHISGMRLLVPVWQTVNIASILIAVGAFVAMFRYKLSMIPTLGISAAVGFIYYLLFGI
ncbi:MAG TPA: chromate efflux transporter [Thermodesulfobacteriota bacterium]|nr:chromate efflux transporter [Thermodesulfobacteriota bacterium]